METPSESFIQVVLREERWHKKITQVFIRNGLYNKKYFGSN